MQFLSIWITIYLWWGCWRLSHIFPEHLEGLKIPWLVLLPCATHDCWLDICSPTKLINSHMNHNTFKPSILLGTTLNTWRLTPHVSRWNIEKVLEIALCLIPRCKPQTPNPLAAVEIESSSRFQSSPNGIDPAMVQSSSWDFRAAGARNAESPAVETPPGSKPPGLGRGWEDGRRWTWRGGTLEVGATIKTVQKQYRKVAHLETVVIFRCCLYSPT